MAASADHLGHVFLRAGQVEQAAGVAMTAARALEPGLATATSEHLSAWGALHLTALIAAARQDDRVAVRQLFGEARATADRLGQDRNDFWTAFGPTNVALHEVSTAVELGDAGEVVRKGEALDPSRFPPGLLGRRAQVFIDLARGYTQQRKDAAAVNMLLEAERIAPEAVRYQVIEGVRDAPRWGPGAATGPGNETPAARKTSRTRYSRPASGTAPRRWPYGRSPAPPARSPAWQRLNARCPSLSRSLSCGPRLARASARASWPCPETPVQQACDTGGVQHRTQPCQLHELLLMAATGPAPVQPQQVAPDGAHRQPL
jgi:hypothetical protein